MPAADGKLRFWRNTTLASLAPGSVARRSATGTLGYEWDEDLDNGSRPPGLVQLLLGDPLPESRSSRTTARRTRPGRRPTT